MDSGESVKRVLEYSTVHVKVNCVDGWMGC